MRKTLRRSTTLSLAALGLTAALLPAAAFARCPEIGTTTLQGSCAPREPCVKRVVNNIIYGFNTPKAIVVYQYYNRTNFGWVYSGYDYGSCTV